MASTKTPVTPISLKLPTELLGVTGDAKPDPRVAELEAKLAQSEARAAKWQKAAQAVMPAADRKSEKPSGKMVADLLPVAGDQFPEQETWWQKQQRLKAKAGR